jgi:hypothetical protein
MHMARELPFNFEMPVDFFEKANAAPGKQRRIGGIASIETDDKQKEQLLARGLDFSEAISDGWFNDNHSKDTDAVIGFPEETRMFKKGELLPSGKHAPAAGHWVEGYLLEDYPRADRIWKLGKSLQKTGRRLGFSVEGKVLKRAGLNKSGSRIIAKAKVRNIAITNCPVNSLARMEVLAKSLQAVTDSTDDNLDAPMLKSLHKRLDGIEKALGMGAATSPNPPAGPQTGRGAGQVLTGESLESKKTPPRVVEEGSTSDDEDEAKGKKKLTKAEVVAWVRTRLPHASDAQVQRFINLTRKLKNQ